MRVRVLGAVGAFADGVEVALPVGRPRALLAMLALAGAKPVSAQHLVTGLWGEDPPRTATKTLQVHMSTLRSRIRDAGAAVELTPAGYRLVVDPREIDLVQFEEGAETGLAALAEHRPDVASRALEQALALWTGDPLSNVMDAPFAPHEAERLTLRRVSVLQSKIDADLALGLGATLVDEVRQVADANPFNERACGHQMVALYRAGQPAAALEVFHRFRRTLGEELGLEPGPELVELERQILMHDDALLVERRGPSRKRHNLPEQLSSFVGRERDVDHVRQMVHDARLTTLTGAGGSGKTRLALSVVAGIVDQFDAGGWFLELAALTVPEHVVTAAAQVLGARPAAGVPGLIEHIGEQHLLVLLDNCEHLIDAAAALTESLLRRCPNLRVLATSREPLGIEGEHVYRVPSLGLAPPDVKDAASASQSAAVRLFVERAQAHRGDLALTDATAPDVAQICRRLDGLPLAIELAASRVRTLPVDQLARRIDERFRLLAGSGRAAHDRQYTLGALIDWSYDLLTEPERLMLERLSVFVGGFTMDAAETICSGPDAPAFDLVAALGDKSLL
jgi:predicted ATPase/DNA-binding SARP family transcriptional activator